MQRDVTKVIEEYENKYEGKSKIYAWELNEIMKQSKMDMFELCLNSIRFGYVLGRRAEKRSRHKKRK